MIDEEAVDAVAACLRGVRFRYVDEDDLQHGLAEALRERWKVRREWRAATCRFDLWLPEIGVVVEAKLAGTVGDVRRQVERYLALPGVNGVVLVTSRARHRLPSLIVGKPVRVVWIAPALL